MKKLFYVMIVSLAVLMLNSCQKEDQNQPEVTPEILLSQNPEFVALQTQCNNMSKDDIIAILESNGEKVAKGVSIGENATGFKNTNEPGSITLSAQVQYAVSNNVLISLMKWQWDTGAAPGIGICASDYSGPGWIYRIRYYWMDVNTGAIHYIRRRSHSCIYNGTGSQDLYWRTRNMKIVSVLGKWYMYNTATGEEVATSGYIPSDPVIARTTR